MKKTKHIDIKLRFIRNVVGQDGEATNKQKPYRHVNKGSHYNKVQDLVGHSWTWLLLNYSGLEGNDQG